MKEKVASQAGELNLDEVFGGTFLSLQESLDAMKPALADIDPTIRGCVEYSEEDDIDY